MTLDGTDIDRFVSLIQRAVTWTGKEFLNYSLVTNQQNRLGFSEEFEVNDIEI